MSLSRTTYSGGPLRWGLPLGEIVLSYLYYVETDRGVDEIDSF
jgi:hypothetical protein